MGRVALGYARWAVPKTDGTISMENVALGVAGMPTSPLRATVAVLWLTPCENTDSPAQGKRVVRR